MKKNILQALLFLVLAMIIIISAFMPGKKNYLLNPEESLNLAISSEEEIEPELLSEYLAYEEEAIILIDLRSPYEYFENHIQGSINIPSQNILDKNTIKRFEAWEADSVQLVLYGNNQLEASGPVFLLQQLGFSNLKVLLGGYKYFSSMSPDPYDAPLIPEYYDEEPDYNYAEIIEESAISKGVKEEKDFDKPVIIKRKKKTNIIEGGC